MTDQRLAPEALLQLLRPLCREAGVPIHLAYGCAMAESGGDPSAYRWEPAKAEASLGLLQVLLSTAREIYPEISEDDLRDPARGAAIGLRYLALCHSWYPEVSEEDRWLFAVAAYNCGRVNVNAALRACRHALGITSRAERGPWQRWSIAAGFLHPAGLAITIPHVARVQCHAYRALVLIGQGA